MSRRGVLVIAVIAAAALVTGTGWLGRRDPAASGVPASTTPATATVERRTLTRTETVTGALGFGDVAAVLGPGAGMITWLPATGDVIGRGGTVYRVDQQRVPLLYGSIPIYRTLSAGRRGDDVRQLERNLAALGYTGFTVDGDYTAATAGAVRQWQRDLGRHRTGSVRPGDAVVSSGARRVAELVAAPGSPAAGVVLKWTGAARVVTAGLGTDDADLARAGAAATLELPDGAKVAARITRVGAPTSSAKGDGGTVPIELAVTQPAKLGRYQAARVDIELAAEARANVLAVPITALVARPGGGYAVSTGGRYLPVRTGMFADTYVEVSGAGLVAGLAVGVPQ